jgi:hypothetical protein
MATDTVRKLQDARDRLAPLEPYPWSTIESWVASARPLIRSAFPTHLDDFDKVTVEPHWLLLPRVSSRGDPWTGEGPSNNFASAAATEQQTNRKRAVEAKERILAFLGGLLDVIVVEPNEPGAVDRIVGMLDRFSNAVRVLSARGRGRSPIQIVDEYDVQYILETILAVTFDDVRPEEWTPSYAGSSSRVDFVLKRHRVAVEAKFARQGLEPSDCRRTHHR